MCHSLTRRSTPAPAGRYFGHRLHGPPWTPLFLIAAAVVTDTGGMLSHGAVVAREYRLPAVVGTRFATARIQDGQMIQVDGDQGVVTLK